MDKLQILKNNKYFSSLNEISIFITNLNINNRRDKYILNHIIIYHIPSLILNETDIEQAM